MQRDILKSITRPEIAANHQFCELVVELINNNKNHQSIKSMLSGYRGSKIGSLFCEAIEIEQEVKLWSGYSFITVVFPPNWQKWTRSSIISGTDKKQHAFNEGKTIINKFHNALSSNFFSKSRVKAGAKLKGLYMPGGDLTNINLHYHALVELPQDVDVDSYAAIAKQSWKAINEISSNELFCDVRFPPTEDLIKVACYLLTNENQSANLGMNSRLHYKTTYKNNHI